MRLTPRKTDKKKVILISNMEILTGKKLLYKKNNCYIMFLKHILLQVAITVELTIVNLYPSDLFCNNYTYCVKIIGYTYPLF